MPTQRQFIEFSDFSGGDTGRERPAASDLKRWRGMNVWVYPNHAIAPRPPWNHVNLSGVTGFPASKTMVAATAAVGALGLWYAVAFSDGTVYSTTPTSFTFALRGTLPSTPIGGALPAGEYIYFHAGSTAGNGGGRVDSSGTFTSIAGMPACNALVELGELLVAAHDGTPPAISWSDLQDPTSWPVANAEFIGMSGVLNGAYVLRDSVVFTKFDGSVWALTGVPGVNEVLRRIDTGLIPSRLAPGAVVGNSVLYYCTGDSISTFDGARLRPMPRPDMGEQSLFTSDPQQNNPGNVVALEEPNKLAIIGTMDKTASPTIKRPWMSVFSPQNGWSRHTVAISDYTVGNTVMGAALTSKDSARGIKVAKSTEGVLIVIQPCDAAGTTTSAYAYLNTRQETPYLPATKTLQWGVTNAGSADGNTAKPVIATFSSAEWWAPQSGECVVRALIIDYSYDTDTNIAVGSEATHSMSVTVEALQRGGGASLVSNAQVVTAGGGNSIDGGTMYRSRAVLRFGEQGRGGGFRWSLADWRGIMIHTVTVVVDTEDAQF